MQRTFVQFFLFIGIVFSLTMGQSFAATVKIGVIDTQKIMKTSNLVRVYVQDVILIRIKIYVIK